MERYWQGALEQAAHRKRARPGTFGHRDTLRVCVTKVQADRAKDGASERGA